MAQVIVHHQEELCTSSFQYFTANLMTSLVTDTIRLIVSANRLVLSQVGPS